jgi:hypothetical protein
MGCEAAGLTGGAPGCFDMTTRLLAEDEADELDEPRLEWPLFVAAVAILPTTSGMFCCMVAGRLVGSSASVLPISKSFQRFFKPSILEERKPCILLLVVAPFRPLLEYWLYLAFNWSKSLALAVSAALIGYFWREIK